MDAIGYQHNLSVNCKKKGKVIRILSEDAIKVLLIEDNPGDSRLIKEMLNESNNVNFIVNTKETLTEGLGFLAYNKIDIVLLDLILPDSSGIDSVVIASKKVGNVPIIVLTGVDNENTAAQTLKNGAQDYLVKGQVDSILLERSIRYAIERNKVKQYIKYSENKYKEAFQKASFYEDMFVHDMNNVLQGILSATQIFELFLDKASKNSSQVKDITNIIQKQIKKGSELISNVRKLSQLEELSFNVKEYDAAIVLRNSIEKLSHMYPDREIKVRPESSNNKVIVVANDYLNDLFMNILNNAVQHNENVIVNISIKISQFNKNEKLYYKFEFKDNGIGIEDNLKKILFRRGSSEDTFQKGLGLGLTLSNKIIQKFRGNIEVENKVENDFSKGSNFIIYLPRGE